MYLRCHPRETFQMTHQNSIHLLLFHDLITHYDNHIRRHTQIKKIMWSGFRLIINLTILYVLLLKIY